MLCVPLLFHLFQLLLHQKVSDQLTCYCLWTRYVGFLLQADVYFTHNSRILSNNSELALTDIGEGADALVCKTSLTNCCATPPNRFGEFYYPSGALVSINSRGEDFYRNRGDQVIRLNRREGVTSPSGRFRCEIPDARGVVQNVFITLV